MKKKVRRAKKNFKKKKKHINNSIMNYEKTINDSYIHELSVSLKISVIFLYGTLKMGLHHEFSGDVYRL